MGIITILWEKWVEFRRDFYKITLAAMIAPLMYLVVFGMGIQTTSHGQPYLNFLIPGVVSLTTMNGSFNAIAQNLCNRVALMDHGKLEEVSTPSALIESLGAYTIDEPGPDGNTVSRYFHSRQEAIDYLSGIPGQASLRETTLEDVFVERAGRHLMPS